MKVNMVGWQVRHSSDFIKERPNGTHGMQIILVRSDARVVMGCRTYLTKKNTIFIVESCYPHALYADGTEYTDDFIRFDLENGDTEFLNSLQLVHNAPILLDNDIVSDMIKVIEDVFNADKPDKNEVLRSLMSALFLQVKSCNNADVKIKHSQYEKELEDIRRQFYDVPSADWNIPEIAKKMNISASHFQRLYKERYGIPCMKDILSSRMEYAKQLLAETEYSTNEISVKCGYRDYPHFSKMFQKYACLSPSQYRKLNRCP